MVNDCEVVEIDDDEPEVEETPSCSEIWHSLQWLCTGFESQEFNMQAFEELSSEICKNLHANLVQKNIENLFRQLTQRYTL